MYKFNFIHCQSDNYYIHKNIFTYFFFILTNIKYKKYYNFSLSFQRAEINKDI